MVEEESEDAAAVVKLLELNDIINTTLERYNLIKKGDLNAAAALPLQPELSPGPSSTPTPTPRQQEVSLIDFDGDSGAASSSAPKTKPADDLLGLAFDSGSSSSDMFGTGGGIALGFGANTSTPPLHDSLMDGQPPNLLKLFSLQVSQAHHYCPLLCKPTPLGSSL